MKNKTAKSVFLTIWLFMFAMTAFAVSAQADKKDDKKKCPTYKAKKVTRNGLHK